jgi:hypothetical protein
MIYSSAIHAWENSTIDCRRVGRVKLNGELLYRWNGLDHMDNAEMMQ